MAAYTTTSQQFIIQHRKNGSVYLKNKISTQRHILGLIVLLLSCFVLTYLVNNIIHNIQQENMIATQLQNKQNILKSEVIARQLALQSKELFSSATTPLAKEDRIQKALISYISSHYLISEKGAAKIVSATIEAGKAKQLEFSFITAIIAIESKFNPYAKSSANAEGLMQVIPRWHPEKMQAIGGSKNIIETRENILAGASTIKEYLTIHNNNEVLALQQYNGSLSDKRRKYSNSVLNEKHKIDNWIQSRIN